MLNQVFLIAFLAVLVLGAKPNIVFVLTDDQDLHMNSLDYMNGVQHNMMQQGATFVNHYCTVSLCCPSRANLWSGRCAHNTNVTSNSAPGGGWEKFVQQGFNDDWLFPWMQQAGYQTYFVGKLLNGFDETNYNKPYPNGFNGTGFLCGKGTYNYYQPKFQINQDAPKTIDEYSTYAIWNMSKAYLDQAVKNDSPFLLVMTPIAPHSGGGPKPQGYTGKGPVPAAQYVTAFPDIEVPRTANFNPNVSSGVDWVSELAQLDASTIAANDEYYRNRIRALQSVDEVVNNTIAYLSQLNVLNDTYIIYSTDNGFHISQHRLSPGKNLPFEEDVNIPMIIRGPGITPNTTVNLTTSHTDVSATILYLAGADLPSSLDGTPMPIINPNYDPESFHQVGIEHWGDASQDEDAVIKGAMNTTYKALRVTGSGYDFYYLVWCGNNAHELYDMTTDPFQMNNLYQPYTYQPNEATNPPYPINRLESRLDALMLVLKSCKAETCTKPWSALHPSGNVTDLTAAMDPIYDSFYEEQQPRVSFSYCDHDYVVAAEGPQQFLAYGSMPQ